MGSYTVIADAGRSILELLKTEMVPEPVKRAETIGLCSPDDKNGCVLGLYLYDIEENPEAKNLEKIILDKEHFKNPPTSLNLYFMLWASSEAEPASRIIDEQRIIGKAIQVINDSARLPEKYLVGTLKDYNEVLDIQGVVIPFEEKQKIFNIFDKKAITSFFYKAGPVFIDSEKVRQIKRVTKADITINQRNIIK